MLDSRVHSRRPAPHPLFKIPLEPTNSALAGRTQKYAALRSPPSAWGWTYLELHLYHYMICKLRPYRTAFGSRVLASACAPRIESAFADHPELFAVSTAVWNGCGVQSPVRQSAPRSTACRWRLGGRRPTGLPRTSGERTTDLK